jgi:enoyl-CoA hydratase/carnithine racemase
MLGVLEELRTDDDIRVVLTTGAGDVAYCAGRMRVPAHARR